MAWMAAAAPLMGQASEKSGEMMGRVGSLAAAPFTIGSAIYQARADRDLQKRNKAKLEELLAMEQRGELGLSGEEKQTITTATVDPVARAATLAQQRADAQAATMGTTSGADQARLREETASRIGGASQEAAQSIATADITRAQQQRNEIEARMAAKAQMRKDDAALISGAVASTLGAAGQMAGAAPGTFSASEDYGQDLNQSEYARLRKYALENEDEVRAAWTDAQATGGPAAAGPTGNIA